MVLVPLSEWGGINLDYSALHNSLGSHQLVVTGIVDNVNQPGLSGDGFKIDCRVTYVKRKLPS